MKWQCTFAHYCMISVSDGAVCVCVSSQCAAGDGRAGLRRDVPGEASAASVWGVRVRLPPEHAQQRAVVDRYQRDPTTPPGKGQCNSWARVWERSREMSREHKQTCGRKPLCGKWLLLHYDVTFHSAAAMQNESLAVCQMQFVFLCSR